MKHDINWALKNFNPIFLVRMFKVFSQKTIKKPYTCLHMACFWRKITCSRVGYGGALVFILPQERVCHYNECIGSKQSRYFLYLDSPFSAIRSFGSFGILLDPSTCLFSNGGTNLSRFSKDLQIKIEGFSNTSLSFLIRL